MSESALISNGQDACGKRERTKAANRDSILNAARQVFAELGYEATTVRDIIRGTDLASGTFYNYFKSKEEVFDALARQSVTEFQPYLRKVKDNADSIEDYIEGAIHAYFMFLSTYGNKEVAARASASTEGDSLRVDTPEMQAVFNEIRRDLEEYLDHQDISGIDTEYLTAAAIGLAREVGGCMILRDNETNKQSIESVSKFASGLLLNGLKSLTSAETP